MGKFCVGLPKRTKTPKTQSPNSFQNTVLSVRNDNSIQENNPDLCRLNLINLEILFSIGN